MAVEFDDILLARERIRPYVFRTPLVRSRFLSELTGGEIHLKLEGQQLLHSFKIRGMCNRVVTLTPAERRRGLIVASSGNHGIAAAYCGQRWNLPVQVVIPENTPRTKVESIRSYGADVVIAGRTYDEACAVCRELRERSDRVFVDSSADEIAVAGHGTIGLEILEDCPGVDTILVPVGGGGLITGIGLAVKGRAEAGGGRGDGGGSGTDDGTGSGSDQGAVRDGTWRPRATGTRPEVIAVQTEACPALKASLEQGVFYEQFPSAPSVCEGLIGGIGAVVWRYARRCVDDVVLTSESAVRRAVLAVIEHEKAVAEASGAVGVAYVMEHPEVFRDRTVVVVISGANLDFDLLTDQILRSAGRDDRLSASA